MDYLFLLIFSVSYLFSWGALAKFSGIPIQAEQPKPEEKQPAKDEPEQEPILTCPKKICPPQLTIEQMRALLGAGRINEPLGGREEDRLNVLHDFFRQIAGQSRYNSSDLLRMIKRSHLAPVTELNLSAAVLLGMIDSEQTITRDEIDVLKEIAKKSSKLTSAGYRVLDTNFRAFYKNASRSLRDDLREIQRDMDTYRSDRKNAR